MLQVYSPNMLKTFKQCPRKFFYRYIKNINMPVNDEIFELGKNIHALVSYYLNKENIYKMEQALSEKEQAIWAYLKNINFFAFETINTEYSLSINIEDTIFGGRIDALLKDNGTYYILDYKTGSIPKDAKYDYQTMIYLLAVSDFFKTENVVFVYIDLKNKENVKIELNASLIKEFKELLTQTVEQIKISDFSKKNNDCDCEYDIICY